MATRSVSAQVHVAKTSAPDDVGLVVAGLGMHGLGEGLVGRADEADDFGVGAGQGVGGQAVQGAVLGDRVDDDPVQGHEDDEIALEGELVETPAARAVLVDPVCERDDRMDVRQVVVSQIDEAEHQGPPALVRRDEGIAAEADLGGGPGEAREQQAAEDREAEEADKGLDGDQDVRRARVRDQLAVADGREGLNAEEETVLEACERRKRRAGQRVRARQPVQRREHEVGGDIADHHQGDQAGNRKREQRVVRVVGMERAQVVASDVEGAVAIEKSDAAPLRELAAEPEVLVESLGLG